MRTSRAASCLLLRRSGEPFRFTFFHCAGFTKQFSSFRKCSLSSRRRNPCLYLFLPLPPIVFAPGSFNHSPRFIIILAISILNLSSCSDICQQIFVDMLSQASEFLLYC